jgi:hypothetical protein
MSSYKFQIATYVMVVARDGIFGPRALKHPITIVRVTELFTAVIGTIVSGGEGGGSASTAM